MGIFYIEEMSVEIINQTVTINFSVMSNPKIKLL